MEAFRTPEERFEGLPDFGYQPSYRTAGDLRVAHVETGEGPPVVMLHGEPSWSFIWRNVLPPVREAGYRCILPDHAGFGRSDKPLDPGWHSPSRHVEITSSLLEELDLRDATMVVHDWGGPIGLSAALAHPDRVARVVILDTVIDPRELWVSDLWVQFREFVEATSDFPAGEIMNATCSRDLPDEIPRRLRRAIPDHRVEGRPHRAADECPAARVDRPRRHRVVRRGASGRSAADDDDLGGGRPDPERRHR